MDPSVAVQRFSQPVLNSASVTSGRPATLFNAITVNVRSAVPALCAGVCKSRGVAYVCLLIHYNRVHGGGGVENFNPSLGFPPHL